MKHDNDHAGTFPGSRVKEMTHRAKRFAIHGAVFALFFASVVNFPPVLETARALHVNDWIILSDLPAFEPLRAAEEPRAGEFVLPPEVQVMLGFLRAAGAREFDFSPAIRSEGPIMQRLVEGAFPMRVMQGAPFYLYLEQEPLREGCSPIMGQGGLALAHCR